MELNQFELFGEYREKLQALQKKAKNFAELGCIDLTYAEVMRHHEGELGSKDVRSFLLIDLYQSAQKHFEDAQMFEKAIWVLGKIQEIY